MQEQIKGKWVSRNLGLGIHFGISGIKKRKFKPELIT
jgi:hypothetical protein